MSNFTLRAGGLQRGGASYQHKERKYNYDI